MGTIGGIIQQKDTQISKAIHKLLHNTKNASKKQVSLLLFLSYSLYYSQFLIIGFKKRFSSYCYFY